jgi:carbonic anhydrase
MPHRNFNTELMTPADALQRLKEGNFRFLNNLMENRNLLEQVNETKEGQKPFATILSCMDSRTSAEMIFDQGLGDIFSIRVAGNVISTDVLGSLEYSTQVAGAKLIVVLGHSGCGAIKGACDNAKLGNLTSLLAKIQPAVMMAHKAPGERNSENAAFVDEVADLNVRYNVQQMMQQSDVIHALVEEGKLGIVPAMYDVRTGKVNFCDDGIILKSIRKAEVAVSA